MCVTGNLFACYNFLGVGLRILWGGGNNAVIEFKSY